MSKKGILIYVVVLITAWILKVSIESPKELEIKQHRGIGKVQSQDLNPHSQEIKEGIEEWRKEADLKGDSLVMYGEY